MLAVLTTIWNGIKSLASLVVPVLDTAGGEQALFRAAFPTAQRPLRVAGAPAGPAPLHVYATPDGIWVTCAGASLTGEQVRRLAITEDAGVVLAAQDGGGGMSTMAP